MTDSIGGENLADNISELSSFSDSSDEGRKVEEVVTIAEEETDKPAYSEDDLDTLVGFMRNMIYLFDYDSSDFNDEVSEMIKLWLIDVNYPLLFIYYDGDVLAASLTFPKCVFNDLMYFMREPDQLFNILERFYDDLMFGTLHSDIEGSLLITLEQVYGPLMLSNTEWSENVKAHVLSAYNTFMSFLTDIHYKLSGFTLLYVPREGSDMEIQEVVLNRTTIKRLEAVVIEWTSQIRSTINDIQHSVPNDLICPSDEYNFWIYRYEILSAVQSQFKNTNIQHIIKILDLAQSLYTKPLREVLNDLMKEIEIAESNIPFLKLLVDPCFAIRSLDNEHDLCSQLIYVMHIIRFIGEDSSHLRQDECITKLFLYLSNEIVSCCMQSIDIDKILSGSPIYGIEVCNVKINCCESFKIIYEEMVEHFRNNYGWKLDYAIIFNRIDAFVQRLHDTLEICSAMKIFGKYSGSNAYKNYKFSCNNAEMFEEKCCQVGAIFTKGIEEIQTVSGSILDINSKEWYTCIAKFREMLKNLDDIIENLLSNVFLVADNIEEKINVLTTLLNFFKRDSIRESFMRKISEIWKAFKAEITSLSKTVSSGINWYSTLFPRKSGQYTLLKIRFERIYRLKDLLERCRFFPQFSESDDILTLFESCENQVKTALKSYNDLWIRSLNADIGSWYQRHLICRSQIRPGLLECHIERRMLVVFDEAYFFKVLQATVPSIMDMDKNDNVKLTFDNVIRIILYFNNVISSISDKERLFFKPMIQQTERKLEPLRGKFTWEEDLGEFIDTFVHNVKDLLDVIQVYKKENIKIANWMENIYNMLLFKLDHEKAQLLVDFTIGIKNKKHASIMELVQVYSEISKHIFCIFEALGSNIRKMGESWALYVQKIDRLLQAAIFNSSLNTLENIQQALQKESSPILSIELILNKAGILFQPSLESIELSLKRLPSEVTSIMKIIPNMCQRFQIDSDCSFYDDFLQYNKFKNIESNIYKDINETMKELHVFREKWNVFRPFWSINRKSFIDKFKLASMTAQAFQRNNEKFEELLNQLTTQKDSTVCKCVDVDALKLKFAITSHINDWQFKYIEYLKCVAYGRIIDFHNTLNNNMKSLSVEPKEVEDLKILEKTYQKCVENLAPFEEEIHIIIEYFNVLEKCVLDILPEAYNLRRNIHPNWQQYIDYLTQIKEQIENYQNQFKLSMANDVAELKVNALEMLKMLENEMPVDDDISPLEAFSKIDLLMKQLEVLEKKENNIREKLKLLGIDYYPLDVISEIRRKLENMNLIWKLVEQWKTMKCQINNIRYSTMEVEETTENITFITSELQNLNKSLQRDEEYPIFQSVKTDINNVHVTFLIFVDMSLSHMRPRHWSDIQLIIDFKFESFELISIEEAMKHKLFCYKQALTQLCLIARKEFTIEEELEKVENVAKTIKYNIQQASNATYSILESEKVFSLLKSNLTIIDQLRQSPYRKHFQENINHWEQNLHFMSDFLELLTLMERQSDTLYEVFNITKFSTNLVDFNETFKMCFDKWTDLLNFLQKTNLQYDICPHAASFTKDTESLRKRFDEMAISLKRMLHHQRSNCNRLFLVPDELLIQMIGFPNDLDTIQASFMYTYENIKKLNIKQIEAPQKYEKRWEIYGIQTNERENVEFNKTIVMDSEQNITTILNQLEISVFETINIALLKCYEYLKQNYFKRLESGWISRWMHQTIIKSTQMENTMHIRNAIVQTNLLGKFKPLKMLRIMHSKMLQGLLTSKQNGMNLNYSVFLRRKLEDLSIVEINTRDVIESLIKAKVSSLSAFEWICQIKSYWNDETKKCSVAQLNSMFAYGYELKECGKPMFITPQSNRMMMTITNIIKNRFIPYVNENSIDHGYRLLNQLAIEIATLFVTLSCNTSWMITDVTRIIDGVKNLQAWICFRNIDKLSSQIQSAINGVIREALVENPKQATLNLKHSKITNHFHIFAIVNDYSYQSPAIDRSIMRPISITLPDRIIVFENLLYLCGFKQYKKLSSLLKLFYECILGSIPSQAHIWTLNRMEQAIFKSTETIRNEQYQEAHVIGYAMEDEFISSLPEKEKDCFTNYVETIFFNGSRLTGDSESDNKSLQKAFQSMNLKHSDISEKRVKQIVQAVRNHRQLIITGAVCSGKSSLINLAIQTLSEQGEHFRKYYVHPMTLNTKTHNNVLDNTIEAILTTIMQSNTHKKKCIILDGPLNDSWLEHIVFDRRQIRSDMLTVSYGVNDVKLIIETVDLHHATPAHISFFPVIHVNSIYLTWRQIIYAWTESEKWADSMKDELQMLVDKYLEIFLNFRHQQCSVNEEQTDVAILYTLCALFDNIFSKWNIENTTGVEKHTEEAITKLFIFCCIWSIGGSLREKERLKLDVFIREQVSETSACFPLKGNVFQYNVSIVNTTSIWELWNIDRIECSSEFVFTLDNRPYHYILSMLMNDKRSVLLTSETTVGKSTLIGNFIKTTHKTKSKICISNLTGKTSINSLRQLLMQHSMNISKNIVYPKERKNLIWFIDDIHNISDSRVEICEFLRRLMEHHSWHENSRSQCIRQTNIVAAMLNSKKLSKHETSFKQLLNKFHIIFYDKSDDENTAIIFKKRVECLTSDELIVKILAAIPSATVDFVRKLSTRFPASPIKPRYEFSLKNISRIIDKFCILKQKSEINNSNNCLRLWIHECFRETYDVLDRTDYNMFYDTFNDTISKYFDFSLHGICPGNRSPIFCDVMNKNATYQDITEISSLKHYMENNLSCTSKLTIYCEAVQHVSKVLRILKTGDSHIVLAGHIGSGRETICQIAAQVSNNTTFKILDIPRDAEKEIVDINIRDLLDCSKKGRTLCVVKIDRLEDINSHILDVINSIIVNQALFGYYPCSNNSRNVVDESAWAQIRENLHFALLLPTSQYQYWKIYHNYPSMMSTVTTSCVHLMTESSLHEVSEIFLKKNIVLNIPILETKADEASKSKQSRKRESLVQSTEERLQIAVSEAISRIHSVTAHELNIANPNAHVLQSWYFELLITFNKTLHNKRNIMSNTYEKFFKGIYNIQEAAENVAELKINLEKQQEQIAVYQQELNDFIENIQIQTANADLQSQEVAIKREKIGAEEIICKQLAAVAETDLNKAMPALNAAIAALDSLNKKDMNEIKSYSRPPAKVELVLNAVMILLGKEPTWAEAKRQLGEQKFLDTLRGYDKNNIPESTLKTIGGFVRNPELEPNKVGVVSKAAKSLMLWVRAIENYGKVYKYVGPKIKKMEDAKNSLREKQLSLQEAERSLKELAEKLFLLRKEYENKIECKLELEEKAKIMALKLERSERLINGLSEENARWKDIAEKLKDQYSRLIGDSIIVAASLVYSGSLPLAMRENLKDYWRIDLEAMEIPFTESFTLFSFFYSNDVLQTWHSFGLPDDDFTVENATIFKHSCVRSPLIVDSQGEISRWIMKENSAFVDFNLDEDIAHPEIETFACNHKYIIAQNLGETNFNHFSKLQKTFTMYNAAQISENDNEKLNESTLVVTTIEDIPYQEKLKKIVNMMNFVLGKSGLEVKLLVTLLQYENPSLEERKDELEQTVISSNNTLKNLEENILQILNYSKIPLIENEELYETLNVSKHTANGIKYILERATLTKQDIEASREIYKSCAARASLLFFILEDLKYMNTMYRFSLDWYIGLFRESLEKSGRDQNIEVRKKKIDDYHTLNLFRNACFALSLSDQTIFAFYLCVRTLLETETMEIKEFNFFLNAAGKIDRQEQVENPSPDWISPAQWDNITELDKLPGLRGITQSFEELNDNWNTWCTSESPEAEKLPGTWDRNLTLFRKYTLVRCIRMDRVEPCMKSFVAINLGNKFLNGSSSTLFDLLKKSSPAIPIILISNDGYKSIEEYHNGNKSNSKLQYVNLITQSIECAVMHLKKCVESEDWLCIDECMESKPWLVKFDHIQRYLDSIDPKSKFRLWMIMNNEKKPFPPQILQNCMKYMCNKPLGIKNNMKQMLEHIGEKSFKKIEKSKYNLYHKKMLFTLTFFHALLIERKKYHDLGWNMQYNFTIKDFMLSERLLTYGFDKLLETKYKKNIHSLNSSSVIKGVESHDNDCGDKAFWAFIRNVVLQIGYGTHFTNIWDQRIYDVHCANIFRKEVLEVSQCALVTEDASYSIPRDGNFASYLNFIANQYPQESGINVLGQHENANIKYLESRSVYALQMLGRIQLHMGPTKYGMTEQTTNFDKAKKITMELLTALPVCLDYDNATRMVEVNKTHVNKCLLLETYKYNVILELIKQNLYTIMSTLSGETKMTPSSLNFLHEVQRNTIPQAWISHPYLLYCSDKYLSDWIIDLKYRVNNLRKWSETGQLSVDVTLGLLLDPKLFIQSVMRMHAEEYKIPLVDLTWDVVVLSTTKPVIRTSTANGFIGSGIHLYNGGWDLQDQCLVPPMILKLIHRMPPILFKPIRKDNSACRAYYQCPCYYSKKEKESLIMEIELNPGINGEDTWIKMNTCMLLNE